MSLFRKSCDHGGVVKCRSREADGAGENKRVGRREGCDEIHASDMEEWIMKNPKHVDHWKHIKENLDREETGTR